MSEPEILSPAEDASGLCEVALLVSDAVDLVVDPGGPSTNCNGGASVATSKVSSFPPKVTVISLTPVPSEFAISNTAVTAEGDVCIVGAEEGCVVGAANAAANGGDVLADLLGEVRRDMGGVCVVGSGLMVCAPNTLAWLSSLPLGTLESWNRAAELVQHSVSSPASPQQNLGLAPGLSTLHCLIWTSFLDLKLEESVPFS